MNLPLRDKISINKFKLNLNGSKQSFLKCLEKAFDTKLGFIRHLQLYISVDNTATAALNISHV